MKFTTKTLARAAVVSAMYVVLTFALQAISFRQLQFRVSEALTLLPVLAFEAVPALAVGCALANLISGAVWYDVVFGSLATLIAALLTRKFREKPLAAAGMPALVNGLVVGPIVYFAYVLAPGDPVSAPAILLSMGAVALGEVVVCYALGLPLVAALKRIPKLWED